MDKVDYIITLHSEQDHSGSIPVLMQKYPQAEVICSPKAKDLLIEHLLIPENKIRTMEDGETLSLGDKSLRFIHTPWVHWPETMVAYMRKNASCLAVTFWAHTGPPAIFMPMTILKYCLPPSVIMQRL